MVCAVSRGDARVGVYQRLMMKLGEAALIAHEAELSESKMQEMAGMAYESARFILEAQRAREVRNGRPPEE